MFIGTLEKIVKIVSFLCACINSKTKSRFDVPNWDARKFLSCPRHKSWSDFLWCRQWHQRKKKGKIFSFLDLVLDVWKEKVFISYKDRLSRVGFGLFKHLFLKFGPEIIVANGQTEEKLDGEEIMNEIIKIITLIHCFSMKHYSKRRVKRALEVLNAGTENKD